MTSPEADTDQLLDQAGRGDDSARGRLLERHRERLRGMVAIRMDPRLAARVDPSDLVQETMAEAHRRLDDFLHDRPLPFYPWLRQLALERLMDLHRRHVHSRKRAVGREHPERFALSSDSVLQLANQLAGSVSSPSARLHRDENRRRLRTALDQLPERDRELLMLRHLEQMSPKEIAATLGISDASVYTRHVRALDKLRQLLCDHANEA